MPEAREALRLYLFARRPPHSGRDRGVARDALVERRRSPQRRALGLAEERRNHPVDDDLLDVEVELAFDAGDELDRLVDGHLFRQRDDDDAGLLAVFEHLPRAIGVAAEDARRHDVDDHLRHAEHVEPVPGRGRVEEDDVVERRAVAPRLGRVKPRLAEHCPLVEPRGRTEEAPHVAVVEDRFVERPRAEHHHPVLLHRAPGLHVDGPDVVGDGDDLGADGADAEERREALFRVACAAEDALALRRERERERGGHGGLADAAFAGDEEEATLREGAHRCGRQA